MIVLIFVVRDDAVDACTGHFDERMVDQLDIACVLQSLGKLPGQANAFIEFADGQEPCIAGKLCLRRLDDDGEFFKKTEGTLPGRLYTHERPPFAFENLFSHNKLDASGGS